MRITQNQGLQGTRRKRAASDNDEANGFANHLGSSSSTQQSLAIDGLNSLSPLGNLLALQDEGFVNAKPRTEYDRGMLTLDRLDDLRLQLLDGSPDRALLKDIEELVRERADETVDPKMREALDEIELRAAVELAKLDLEV